MYFSLRAGHLLKTDEKNSRVHSMYEGTEGLQMHVSDEL